VDRFHHQHGELAQRASARLPGAGWRSCVCDIALSDFSWLRMILAG
jgi:hypothetical protein